ncbi:hypothetical protein [Streptomyces malaysiensis]
MIIRIKLGTMRPLGWWRFLPLYVSPVYAVHHPWNPRGWHGVAIGSFGFAAYVALI